MGTHRRQSLVPSHESERTVRGIDDQAGVHAGNRSLASRIDRQDQSLVGGLQGGGQLGREELRPAEQVGLEDRQESTARVSLAHRRKSRLDLRRMVSVVIEQCQAVVVGQKLESTLDAPEFLEGQRQASVGQQLGLVRRSQAR